VRVESLFRYPVKSMRGETIGASVVAERGFLGDRAFAVFDDETGKVASAKHPRRWGRLLECRAEYVDDPVPGAALPPVRITLPDDTSLLSTDADADDRLSRFLGRRVRLESDAPERPIMEQYRPGVEGFPDPSDETVADEAMALVAPHTFFDAAPLHFVTTATLARSTSTARRDFPRTSGSAIRSRSAKCAPRCSSPRRDA
jgi:uncharacterized protein YcbX